MKCMWCDEEAEVKGQFIVNGLYYQACMKHAKKLFDLIKER